MALQGTGAISMGDMRTEFGISGAISMSDLYRGGSEVPANGTVGGSIASLTGSQNGYGGSSTPILNHYYAVASRFTGNMTCGNNGDVTADGDITFTTTAIASGDNAENMAFINSGSVNTGGVRIATTDASADSNNLQNGILNTGTSPIVFKSFSGTQTSAFLTGGTYVTTIPNGTSFDIPSGVTSFKMFSHASGRKRMTGGNEGSVTITIGNGSGNYTSTGTINTGVPQSSTISFSDLYGATA